jgi:hypothetical protein
MPVAHTCNPSYLRGRDQEDGHLKPAQAKSLGDPVLKKYPTKKWTGRVIQVVEHLLSKFEILSSNLKLQKKKKKKNKKKG